VPLAGKNTKRQTLSLPGLLLAGLAGVAATLAVASSLAEPPPLLVQKARLVESVIMRSVSEAGGRSVAASAELTEAQRLLDSARSALADGRNESAAADLNSALKLAVQVAGGQRRPETSSAWLKARYGERLEGVRAFRRAFDDVIREKGLSPAAVVDLAALEATVDEGERLAAAGRYADADQRMRRAYDILAQALASLREHETLEHSLVFATPADEYAYEEERFRSHEMLLQMMNDGRPQAPEVRRDSEQFRAAADALAGQARAHAAEGDYQRAIEAGEAATEQLVRALREAGLFLPY
jgi:hypothetical protein